MHIIRLLSKTVYDLKALHFVLPLLLIAGYVSASQESPDSYKKENHNQASHEQKVQALFALINLPAVYRREVEKIVASQKDQIDHFEYFEDVIREWATQVTGWEVLQPKIAELYKSSFTEAELNDMLVFYGSETGQKFLQLQPLISTRIRQMGTEAAQQNRGRLKTMLQNRAEELKRMGLIKSKPANTENNNNEGVGGE
ncbi:DUF2059 domain-containing protein [Spongorhabdus nitratireducens]